MSEDSRIEVEIARDLANSLRGACKKSVCEILTTLEEEYTREVKSSVDRKNWIIASKAVGKVYRVSDLRKAACSRIK